MLSLKEMKAYLNLIYLNLSVCTLADWIYINNFLKLTIEFTSNKLISLIFSIKDSSLLKFTHLHCTFFASSQISMLKPLQR